MTLKTGAMVLKIQICITEINHILKYIQIETRFFNSNNISQYFWVFLYMYMYMYMFFLCVFFGSNKCSLDDKQT